jgi:hypothetical protein
MTPESYDHTQRSPLHFTLLLFSALLVGIAAATPNPFARVVMAVVALVFLVLGSAFMHLRVHDGGEALRIRYGPLPLFRRELRYADVKAVRVGRSKLIDGWGIHWIPRRGWTWNLWGFDCVELETARGILRIGTDEPRKLAAFLRKRIGERTA